MAGLIAAGWLVSSAAGAITYLTQVRSVEANAFVNGQPEGGAALSAPNFGDFNGTRMHTLSQGGGSVFCTQSSRLRSDAMFMDAQSIATRIPVVQAEPRAYSRFEVTFLLTDATPFELLMSHSTTGNFFTRLAQARLTGPSGIVFEWIDDFMTANTWPATPYLGTLAAGQYNFRVDILATRGTGAGTNDVSASIALYVPGPGCGVVATSIGIAFAVRRRRRH